MGGETKLEILLRNMNPQLLDAEFVFCTLPPSAIAQVELHPIGQFMEEEGWTLILLREEAEQNNLEFTYPCRMITLQVHSNLEAVGLLAAVTGKLAQREISVNAISAYFHDHLFVPTERANEAIHVLRQLSTGA